MRFGNTLRVGPISGRSRYSSTKAVGPTPGPVFLSQNIWVEAWDPRAVDLIAGRALHRGPSGSAHPDLPLYRALGLFREEDHAFHFGREANLQKLLAAVEQYPLVAVVGASGSGKSSLAQALLPFWEPQQVLA